MQPDRSGLSHGWCVVELCACVYVCVRGVARAAVVRLIEAHDAYDAKSRRESEQERGWESDQDVCDDCEFTSCFLPAAAGDGASAHGEEGIEAGVGDKPRYEVYQQGNDVAVAREDGAPCACEAEQDG